VAGQLLLRLEIALERTTRQRLLLLTVQEGDPADLLKVEVEALPPLLGRLGQR
jgi:hypothetical protein